MSSETSNLHLQLNHEGHARVLALDIGTSGVRASLFDELGSEIEGASARTDRSCVSLAVLDPVAIVDSLVATIDLLLAKTPKTEVETVAISCFWHTLVGIDSYGQPTTDLLGWADMRAAVETQELRAKLDERETHARTGCRIHPGYWPAKLLWLRKTELERMKRTKQWLSFGEFVTSQLFDSKEISVSMASGTGLMNQRTCAWDETVLDAIGVSPHELPGIAADGLADAKLASPYAKRWPQLANAHLLPAIADGAANNIGAGCTSQSKLALMIGTSGAARILYEGDPPQDFSMSLWSYRADRKRVVVGGALSDGGGLYQWLKNALLPNENGDSVAAALTQLPPDGHGLTVLPFWAGERSPGWSLNARGGIFGMTSATKPIEILRAAMESVAYRFALIVRALDEISPDASIVAAGNALQSSPVWVQILADVLGRSIALTNIREASSRGAALLALEATGKIANLEKVESTNDTTIEPDSSRHSIYQKAIERQIELYKRVIGSD